MASFVRQLNMYGFRKVVHIEQGGLVKPEKDDTEFQHPYFIRGQEQLLENIKRKVTSVSSIKNEDIKVRQDNVTKLLTDVQMMKGKQESMDSKLIAMKQVQGRITSGFFSLSYIAQTEQLIMFPRKHKHSLGLLLKESSLFWHPGSSTRFRCFHTLAGCSDISELRLQEHHEHNLQTDQSTTCLIWNRKVIIRQQQRPVHAHLTSAQFALLSATTLMQHTKQEGFIGN
ncbi:Heat shock factor protein 1 [Chelonia mydas]|uniref:Heat shock factor protein 1 n=1 Tax=Chelonia mydas TaxID=8469 RepID=M7ARL5_CHEMY|nr:Heat shock factor protein 1 [Chelonia mydas]